MRTWVSWLSDKSSEVSRLREKRASGTVSKRFSGHCQYMEEETATRARRR